MHAVLQDCQNQMVVFSSNVMSWFILISKISFAICFAFCIYTLFRIISLGKPKDYAKTKGDINSSIKYSYTGGMSPVKKESAYLHLPTYIAGILYHLGTFLSLILFFLNVLGINLTNYLIIPIAVFLIISGICGVSILIKRIFKSELNSLSNVDDYISNVIVNVFQFVTIYYLFYLTPIYFVISAVLFLYLPIGKLKHAIYFFAARFHLGFFYGKRGVWPPQN